MKVSQITKETILNQLRENEQALSQSEIDYILSLKAIAVEYVKSYTGIQGTDEVDDNDRRLDDYEDITYAVLAIISFMYDNRTMTVDKSSVNPMVNSILDLHSFNLVPSESEATS